MNNNKKEFIVGCPGWKTGDNSFGCGTNHLDYISKFGVPRILFPQDGDVDVDLLYLPGGPDVNPSAYGAYPGFTTSNQDVFRQYFFDNNLRKFVERGTPIFGVCLGMQMLNVHFGGTLTQEMRYHAQSKGRWEEAHDVFIDGQGKGAKFKVNSHHHQAITKKDLSEDFNPLLWAKNEEDDTNPIVEGFIHKSLPIAGVQYHPEEWRDEFSENLILQLLRK